jgi:hypothetical protein
MTDQNIPKNIAAIIQNEEVRQEKERQVKELARLQEEAAWIEKGRSIVREVLALGVGKLPAQIREYVIPIDQMKIEEDELSRLGHGWVRPDGIFLQIRIPGLAPIEFNPEKEIYKSYNADQDGTWSEPVYRFRDNNWYQDPAPALVDARRAFVQIGELQASYEALKKVREEEQLRVQEEDSLQEQKTIEAAQRKSDDARLLVDQLDQDPVAIFLLKGFLAIQRERREYLLQIEGANDSLSAMEERYSRKAADLRRQLKDAEQETEDERRRKEDLRDELDKVEKKAKRGW